MRTIGAFSNAVQHGTTCVTHDGICCEDEEEEEEEEEEGGRLKYSPSILINHSSSDSCLTL
jgi:hypothetical protein